MSTYELSLTSNYVADWDFPMAIRELIQNGDNDDVEFLKYTSNRSKMVQTCMDAIEKQGKEHLTVQLDCEGMPEEVTQAIPVTEPSEYEKIKRQGGNPVFVKPQVYSLIRYVAQERTENLYRYRKEAPVEERTLKEEFEFWLERYGEELSYEAENELKQLIEQV